MRAAPVYCSDPLERVRAETHRGHEEGEGRERDVQRQPVELAPADVGGGGADHKQNRADSRDRSQRRHDLEVMLNRSRDRS
jgi:hypothetical protein